MCASLGGMELAITVYIVGEELVARDVNLAMMWPLGMNCVACREFWPAQDIAVQMEDQSLCTKLASVNCLFSLVVLTKVQGSNLGFQIR